MRKISLDFFKKTKLNFSRFFSDKLKGEEMISVFLITGILISIAIGLSLYRVIKGPGVFNRTAAVNIIGTKTIALLVVMGYYFERPYFFDIALLYAMINFVGTLVFAKYLERGNLWS